MIAIDSSSGKDTQDQLQVYARELAEIGLTKASAIVSEYAEIALPDDHESRYPYDRVNTGDPYYTVESWQRGIRERKERQYGKRPGGAVRLQHAPQLIHLPSLAGGGLWRGCRNMSCPEMLETAGNASKATAEVACGCELRFDRLS